MPNEDKSLEELAQEAKREYHRDYYRKNKKAINAQSKRWRDENPDKVAAANLRYWAKKAQNKRA